MKDGGDKGVEGLSLLINQRRIFTGCNQRERERWCMEMGLWEDRDGMRKYFEGLNKELNKNWNFFKWKIKHSDTTS